MADKWADKWANSEKNEDNCMRTLHLLMNSRCSVFCALRMCLHVPRYNDFANNICYDFRKSLKTQMIMKKSAMYVIMICDRVNFQQQTVMKNYFCANV